MRRCQVILFDGTERPIDLGRGPTWHNIRDLVADTSHDILCPTTRIEYCTLQLSMWFYLISLRQDRT